MTNKSEIGNLINASTISNPIIAVKVDEITENTYSEMETHNYDIFGVKDSQDINIGYLERIDNQREIKHFEISRVISAETPMNLVFDKLLTSDYLFILVEDKVKELITVADITKFPARAFVFSIINQLEIEMTSVIRKKINSEEIGDYISETRTIKAQSLYSEKKLQNLEIDIFECLELYDKAKIYFKIGGFSDHGFDNRDETKTYINKLIKVRNAVAHGNDYLMEFGRQNTIECILRAVELYNQIKNINMVTTG